MQPSTGIVRFFGAILSLALLIAAPAPTLAAGAYPELLDLFREWQAFERPALRDGAPDLSYVASAGEKLTRVLRAGALIVLESTTYPGTTEELLRPVLEQSGLRAGTDFYLGYSPERIDPGNKTWNFVNTPKVVSGVDAGSLRAVSTFYASLVDRVVEVESAATAELVKILENTYRHVNIALVTELAATEGVMMVI